MKIESCNLFELCTDKNNYSNEKENILMPKTTHKTEEKTGILVKLFDNLSIILYLRYIILLNYHVDVSFSVSNLPYTLNGMDGMKKINYILILKLYSH